MLRITIPAGTEQYDERTNYFLPATKEQTICIEHSLVSISKWESKWHKPYLDEKEKTMEECIDYVRCMTLTQNVDPRAYYAITPQLWAIISDYINDPMTATTVQKTNMSSSRETITSEVIYYWMIYYGIPFECQKWHLSRLLMLISVCNAKSSPPKKMSRSEIYEQNRMLNAARRKRLNSRG